MEFYNLFKSFLGIPNSVPPRDFSFEDYNDDNGDQNMVFQPLDPKSNDGDVNWFNLMENPAELHQFVEEQMQHLMSTFGLISGNSLLEPRLPSQKPSSLRDLYLKPGFDHPSTSKVDTDMDDKVDIKELDSILKQKQEMNMPVTPYTKPKGQLHFFGQSMSTKTVVRPDGTVETTKTMTDNAGNRETTITRRDKTTEHTVITRISADGKEVKEETVTNLEGQLDQQPSVTMPHVPHTSGLWFDAFFK